ncbi:rhodanese-like domain-containing protein [Halarcobacter sp.]|uniref:rhodanese-like domain-containing protein n=1 Tax=Halarcobacter sp. TaxID=2321133 RepID=UPI0029F4FD7F|nr:rhodanese-like domain-containing protein [Halarcobacter sp.]
MKIFLLLILLLNLTFADFIGITPKILQEKIDENVVVIDIRTPPEWKELGVVPTSKKIMFFNQAGKYDVENWLNEFSKYVKDKNQAFVLVCRSGNRTGVVGNFLSNKLGYKKVFHLEHGIKSWIKENRNTIK